MHPLFEIKQLPQTFFDLFRELRYSFQPKVKNILLNLETELFQQFCKGHDGGIQKFIADSPHNFHQREYQVWVRLAVPFQSASVQKS